MGTTQTIQRHNDEIHANALMWERKPALRLCYRDFHSAIAACLAPSHGGGCLEIGSGIGKIKEVLPDCITSDLFGNPWIDREENAYHLDFKDGSLDNIIMFDVFHHLEYPGSALAESWRVLRPGGRLTIFEPDVGWLGRMVYGVFHPEPLGLDQPIDWTGPPHFDSPVLRYYAAQGNASRVFVKHEIPDALDGWELVARIRKSALTYVASGGFSGRQLYPTVAYPVLRWIERLLDRFPAVFATRLLVSLQKQ
ncbi:MAG: class I SAM-dependent methyltransferase [Magnetococcales bacterium]|nr:class I SAM-dependent methyltransferase [Magnetococcales bacterium]